MEPVARRRRAVVGRRPIAANREATAAGRHVILPTSERPAERALQNRGAELGEDERGPADVKRSQQHHERAGAAPPAAPRHFEKEKQKVAQTESQVVPA